MRKEVIGSATLYLGDCREILSLLPPHDLLLTDPPYGIGYDPKSRDGNFSELIEGDDSPFDPKLLNGVGAEQIIWGANNFSDKVPHGGWFVWDKRCSDAADKILGSPIELAWVSNQKKYAICRLVHAGKLNADGNDARRVHPTQKPIKLMQWSYLIFQRPKQLSIHLWGLARLVWLL